MALEYKEPDRAYVARQLNGPVISAFIKAVYNYLHSFMDSHCDYFKNLSIQTADTAHLKFIGNLMGLQLFQLFTDPSGGMYLVFTDDAFNSDAYDYDNGWAEAYRAYQSGDGVFGTGEERDFPVVLSDEQYRRILDALSQSSTTSVDSILVVDTLVNVFLQSTDYNINYNSGYIDVLNVVLGPTAPQRYVTILQSMFDRLYEGAGITILVSHI